MLCINCLIIKPSCCKCFWCRLCKEFQKSNKFLFTLLYAIIMYALIKIGQFSLFGWLKVSNYSSGNVKCPLNLCLSYNQHFGTYWNNFWMVYHGNIVMSLFCGAKTPNVLISHCEFSMRLNDEVWVVIILLPIELLSWGLLEDIFQTFSDVFADKLCLLSGANFQSSWNGLYDSFERSNI